MDVGWWGLGGIGQVPAGETAMSGNTGETTSTGDKLSDERVLGMTL